MWKFTSLWPETFLDTLVGKLPDMRASSSAAPFPSSKGSISSCFSSSLSSIALRRRLQLHWNVAWRQS